METQQLSVLNVRNNAATENRSASASASNGTEADDQQAPFDEQLNQQIEQGRQTSKSDNNQQNQQYSEGDAKQHASGEQPQEHSNLRSGNAAEEATELSDVDNPLPGRLTPELDLGIQSTTLNVTEETVVVAETTPQLPQDGNLLPQAAVPQTQRQAPAAAVASAATSTDTAETNPLQLNTQVNLTRVEAGKGRAAAQASATALSGQAENSGRAAMQFPDVMLNRSQTLRNQPQTAGTGELKAEMMNLASLSSRQQQVPQATSISASQLAPNAAVASLLGESQPMGVNTPTLTTASLSASVASPQWSQQMTNQVAMMLTGGIQQAEIKLNPAHLGPMEIKLAINDDQASINFVTQHAPVRDAIDNALPRLREMLEQQGLNLADVDVSTQSEQQAKEDAGTDSQNRVEDAVESGDIHSETDATVHSVDVESGVSLYA